MGETISTLVFRPPPPTPIQQNKFFYITVLPKQPTNVDVDADCDFACSARCGEMAPEMDFFPNSKQFKRFQDKYKRKLKKNTGKGTNTACDSDNGNGGGNGNGMNTCREDCTEQNNGVISSVSLQPSSSSSSSSQIPSNEQYKIPAFFLRRKGAKVTILFSHGNAEDLGMMYRRMKEMAMSFCANVLAYDYTGYGLSTAPQSQYPQSSQSFTAGSAAHNHTHTQNQNHTQNQKQTRKRAQPSEEMCYRNIEAAYRHLTETMKIPPSEIVLYGRSLGSGPSCYLAKKTADEGNSVGGLILHSPFLSIYRIVIDCRVNLVGDMFINKSKAPHIRCPVLIIHGTKDDVVPFWHGDELLRSFPPEYRAQPFWVNGLGHNHIEVKRKDEYVKRILNFIEMYVTGRQQNKQGTSTSTSTRTQDSYSNRGTPAMVIPEREQYKPETTLKESGKFLVNQTWMKHGLEIVSEAINDKKDKLKKKTTDVSEKNNQYEKKIQHENRRTEQIQIRMHEPQSSLPPPPPPPPPPSAPVPVPQSLPPQETFKQQIQKLSSDTSTYYESKHQNVIKPVHLKKLNSNDLMMKAKEAQDENKSAIRAKREMDTSSYASQGSSYSIESATSRYLLTKESWGTDDEEEDVSFDDDAKENIDGTRGVSLQTFTQGNLSGFSLQSSFNNNACELSLCKDIEDDEKKIDNALLSKKSKEYRTKNFPRDRYSFIGGH